MLIAIARRVFAALAGVALAADAVHRDGQRSVCASVLMEPSDIAPVAKRLTISAAGSTSSMQMAFSRVELELEEAAHKVM